MTKNEILATLARDYKSAHIVYASMEKQAAEALKRGHMDAYHRLKDRARDRAFTLRGIKRAAVALGINEIDFMEYVGQLLNT